MADPLLDGVCARLVKRLVRIYVIGDFLFRERLEPYPCGNVEAFFLVAIAQRDGRCYVVFPSGKVPYPSVK